MNWNHIDIEQRRKELIEQAQRDMLAQEFLSDMQKNNPALAWVGQRIADFGMKLVKAATPGDQSKQDTSLN